jgi:hypothetical protein
MIGMARGYYLSPKQKSLDFLVFLWPNRYFSMGYGESKQKNLVRCHTVAKMSQTRFTSSFLEARAALRSSWRTQIYNIDFRFTQ